MLKMDWRKFEALWSLSIRISCQNLKTLNISRDNRQKLEFNMSPKKFFNHDVLCSLARPQIPILHKILTYLTKKINSFPSILKIWARLDHFQFFLFVCLRGSRNLFSGFGTTIFEFPALEICYIPNLGSIGQLLVFSVIFQFFINDLIMLIMEERYFSWTCGFRQMLDKYLYYDYKEKTRKFNDVIFF